MVNAHKINAGETVILDNKSRDFFFLKRQDARCDHQCADYADPEEAAAVCGCQASSDIQVLTPMRKGLLGVERLNADPAAVPEPAGSEGKQRGDTETRLFREGDKVMQIKNNYQLEWEIRTRHGIDGG